MNSDIFIMHPLSAMFFILLGLFALFAVVFICIFRNKSDRTRRIAITVFYGITTAIMLTGTYMLSIDEDYTRICIENGIPTFNILRQLPLHLCNINAYFIIVSVWSKKRTFLAFSFFTATLGAIFPLFFPAVGFDGYSILIPRVFISYFMHYAILLEMPLLYGLDLYRPKFRDVPKLLAFMMIVLGMALCFDLFLVKTGLCEGANYFFTLSPEGNGLLSIFYSWIPIPGLYLLPGVGIAIALVCIFTVLFNLKDLIKKLKKS